MSLPSKPSSVFKLDDKELKYKDNEALSCKTPTVPKVDSNAEVTPATMACLLMDAEEMAKKTRDMYFLRMTENASMRLQMARQTHNKLTQDVKHLTEEGRKLHEMIRETREALMVDNESKYGC